MTNWDPEWLWCTGLHQPEHLQCFGVHQDRDPCGSQEHGCHIKNVLGHWCAWKLVPLLPAAALWYWGILVSGRLKLGSSRRMSRLSFRLLLFDVFADLHLVFLFGILVGNFIFNFLLFSYTERQNQKWTLCEGQKQLQTQSSVMYWRYLGCRTCTCK